MIFISFWGTSEVPVIRLSCHYSVSNPVLVNNDLTETNLQRKHHCYRESKLNNVIHVRCLSLLLQDDHYSHPSLAKKLGMCSSAGLML